LLPTGDPAPRERRRPTDPGPAGDQRPFWLPVAAAALFMLSFFLSETTNLIDTGSAAGLAWRHRASVVEVVMLGLACIGLFLIPGALMALRRPWGDVYLRVIGRPYVHPRLFGLTLAWAGLILASMAGAPFFLNPSAWSWAGGLAILLAMCAVSVVPFAAVLRFDRRREPPDGQPAGSGESVEQLDHNQEAP
jgi:hypothetical protein